MLALHLQQFSEVNLDKHKFKFQNGLLGDTKKNENVIVTVIEKGPIKELLKFGFASDGTSFSYRVSLSDQGTADEG